MVEAGQRRADPVEPLVHQPRLAPQRRDVGGEAQHVLGAGQRAVQRPGAQPAQLDVVLQPQQHLAPGHRAQQAGAQLGALPFHPLEQDAQGRGFQRRAAGEDIDQELPARPFQRQQEVAREIHAMGGPAGRLGRVQPEDAERDRQPPPAFQHADQIGVGLVVIGLAVPGQAEGAVQHAGQHGAAAVEVAGIGLGIRRRCLHGSARDLTEAQGGGLPVGLGRIDAGELQRDRGDVEFGVGQTPRRIECGAGLPLLGRRHAATVATQRGSIKA